MIPQPVSKNLQRNQRRNRLVPAGEPREALSAFRCAGTRHGGNSQWHRLSRQRPDPLRRNLPGVRRLHARFNAPHGPEQPGRYLRAHSQLDLRPRRRPHSPASGAIPSLRAMPRMLVFRHGDSNEKSHAYKVAIENRRRPSSLCLSRQGMADQANSSIDKVALGGYVIEDCAGTPDLILIGTGTELDLCVQAAKELTADGKKVRVVSMPWVELFDEQSDAYKEEVLPNAVRKRLVVAAAESFGWHRFIGLDGDSVTMNRFGASAPGGTCLKEFGFTMENVAAKAKALLG